MNIHKHMEAIFVVTLAVTGVGKFALDSLPSAAAGGSGPMARNTVTPAAKAASVHGPAPMPARRA